jgi:hypothetical protein
VSKIRTAFRGASITVAVAVLAATFAQPASAGSSSDYVVIRSEPGGTVSIPRPGLKTKNIGSPFRNSTSTMSGGVSTMSVQDNAAYCTNGGGPVAPCQLNIHSSTTRYVTPPGGTGSYINSKGTAFLDIYTITGCCFTQADYYTTQSSSEWSGTNPFNASSLTHTDIWDVDYVAVTWGFGASVSGTANLGNGRVSFSNTQTNTWKVAHDVQHVWIYVQSGSINRVILETHGSFGLSGTFFTTDTSSRVAIV